MDVPRLRRLKCPGLAGRPEDQPAPGLRVVTREKNPLIAEQRQSMRTPLEMLLARTIPAEIHLVVPFVAHVL